MRNHEYNAQGAELNQRDASDAVTIAPSDADPGFSRDAELFYQPSTNCGAKLPRAWLRKDGRKVSTLDLIGNGAMTFLTGICGDASVEAARAWSVAAGGAVEAHLIGPSQPHTDMFGDWPRLSGVAEDGAILFRPDGHVAWRSVKGMAGTDAFVAALEKVLALPSDAGPRAVQATSKDHETEWT